MIRGVAVEFAGQSVYPTMILRSSTAPLSLPLMSHGFWGFQKRQIKIHKDTNTIANIHIVLWKYSRKKSLKLL